jgi:uncharacterized membrane protein YhaH (DUF805 family)
VTHASAPATGSVPLSQPYYGASIGEAFRRFWSKYATFSGRASRSEYWWWALIAVIVTIVLEILGAAGGASSNGSGPGAVAVIAAVFGIVWGLATIIPTLALLARRLHDANYSGWFMLLALIPFVGGIIVLVFSLLPSNPAGQRFDLPGGR